MNVLKIINPGIGLMILVALYQSIISAMAKAISLHITTSVQVFAYYAVPLVFLLPMLWYKGFNYYRTNRLSFHFLRGVFAVGSVFCFFYASEKISLGTAAVLFNLTPVFVPLFARIFLNEKTSRQVLIGIFISLIGVFIIFNPSMGGFFVSASLIGLASGILMAIAQVMLRFLAKEKESLNKIVFYLYLTSVITAFFMVLIDKGMTGNYHILSSASNGHGLYLLGMLIALGVISLIAQRTLTKAFQYLPASKLAPVLYMSIPFSSLIGLVIWQQKLTMNLFFGTAFILIGVLCFTFDQIKINNKVSMKNFLNEVKE